MFDHNFLFTGAVRGIKQFVDAAHWAVLYYYDSTRVNLWPLWQQIANVHLGLRS